MVRDLATVAFGNQLPVLEFDTETELAARRERGLPELGVGRERPDPRALFDLEVAEFVADGLGEFVRKVETQHVDPTHASRTS